MASESLWSYLVSQRFQTCKRYVGTSSLRPTVDRYHTRALTLPKVVLCKLYYALHCACLVEILGLDLHTDHIQPDVESHPRGQRHYMRCCTLGSGEQSRRLP